MDIVYVTGAFAQNGYDNALGGMEKSVYNHAKGMISRGHSVRILTTGSCNRKWKYKGIEVWDVYGNNDLTVKTGDLLFNIIKREKAFNHALDEMEKIHHIDIIQYTGWFGVGFLHKKNKPAIMRISSYTKEQLCNNYSASNMRLLSFFELRAAKRMDFVFAPSVIMANAMQRDLAKKISVIETPFIPENVSENYGKYKMYCDEKKYFLFFGRMTVDKGINVIKEIIYELLGKYNDYYFVFSGYIDDNKLVTSMYEEARDNSDRIIFTGKLQHSELYPIIRNAAVIVMPSIKDNLPNGCAEAMYLKKIVVGTYKSSLDQYIDNGVTGLLAEAGNPKELLFAIEKYMGLSEEEKRMMEEAAHRRICNNSADVYFLKLERIYKKLLRKSKL